MTRSPSAESSNSTACMSAQGQFHGGDGFKRGCGRIAHLQRSQRRHADQAARQMDAKDRLLSGSADQAHLDAAVEQQQHAFAAIALVKQAFAAFEFPLDAARRQLAHVLGCQRRAQILVRSDRIFAHPALSFGTQKQLAARSAGFQIDMGLARLRQRELPIDGNMQGATCDQSRTGRPSGCESPRHRACNRPDAAG